MSTEERPVAKRPAVAISDPASVPEPVPSTLATLPHLIGRLHRLFLDALRVEMLGLGVTDLSAAQAHMLMILGGDDLTPHALMESGHYLGADAAVNLKALVDAGYVESPTGDRRGANLTPTDKGRQLHAHLTAASGVWSVGLAGVAELEGTLKILRRLERNWSDAIRRDAIDVE